MGEKNPTAIHHRTASGIHDDHWNELGKESGGAEGWQTEYAHTLYGALIGGPDSKGNYDQSQIGVSNYEYTEVAIDYNAGYTAALCAMIDDYGGTKLADFPPRETPTWDEWKVGAVLNGKGELLGSGYVDEVAMNISQIRVKLYNLEGEMVYDSKDVSIDSTEVKLDPFVEASLVKIEIANGKGEGSEFMWEVETYVEEGNHVFEQTDSLNPTCNRPGYKEYTCDSPECGKVIKKTVPATGFHAYDNGVVTIPATADDNGVLTKTCISCGEKKEFDIPALGHNWNNGVTTDPTCDTEGSTVYTCTGCSVSGCTATYTADVKQALGHDWDDGVITKKATSSSHGEKEFTCFRCNEVEVRKTRILQYTDSTANFEFVEGKYDVVVDYNEEDALYENVINENN